MRQILSLAILAILAGCAQSAQPLAVKAQPAAKAGSISDLELATAQLREQHSAMSETLNWMEGEVTALKMGSGLPAARHSPTTATINEPETTNTEPTKLAVPKAEPAKPAVVGSLTAQDLEVSEPAAAPAVHLASYTDKKQVMPGWEKLKAKYTKELAGLSPSTKEFTDSNGKKWYRLYAGPLASADDATQRCRAIKGAGGWCE